MRRRNNPEADLQRACVRYMQLQYPQVICFHPANGGYRSKVEAAIFSGMGVLPGIPDLVICQPAGNSGALFVELKAGRNGTTDIQEAVIGKLKLSGYQVAVVRSLDEFIELVDEYMCQNVT